MAAFRNGLGETGYVQDRNVTVEYHWLEGEFERLPALMADIVCRRVAVIATPTNTLITTTAQAATALSFGNCDKSHPCLRQIHM